jgi:hypothetical protein
MESGAWGMSSESNQRWSGVHQLGKKKTNREAQVDANEEMR